MTLSLPPGPSPKTSERYRAFHREVQKTFGERIFRITINTGLTCPNIDGTRAKGGCTFCQDASYLGLSFQEGLSVEKQLQTGMEYVRTRHQTGRFFAYFQNGTNTHAPVPVLKKIYNQTLADSNIVGLMIGTRADCLGPEVLDLLEELNGRTYLWLELGLQSHKNDVLKRINRAHTAEEFESAAKNLDKRKIKVCAHVILGLPSETPADTIDKTRFINKLPVAGIKIHNLVVFKKTALEKQYREGTIALQDLKTYASACTDFLEHLRPDIMVQRLNAHGPREITVAPDWSINKMATMNAIHDELEKRDTWQGKKLGSRLEDLS